jgi:hypothetical protein
MRQESLTGDPGRKPGPPARGLRRLLVFSAMTFLFCIWHGTSSHSAETSCTFSGRLKLRGVVALDPASMEEDPSLYSRTEIDVRKPPWRLHAWLEGAWDGDVRSPRRDHSFLKSFDEVYQDNTPYLEIKELYAERSMDSLDIRVGIQRFSWGRLDEYPVNDLFNPWDYTQFIVWPMEERKIGVPSVSGSWSGNEWTCQAVWAPWLVPYRLPQVDERWSVVPAGTLLADLPDAEVIAQEPDLPARKFKNGSFGLRLQRMGDVEWAVNLFHGYDPRPVFRTTRLRMEPSDGGYFIDPGFIPSFHKITSIGMDGATVMGDWSLRGEAAYTFNRVFDVRQELWGYPEEITARVISLNPIEVKRNTLDYGMAADYRLFEDGLLTLQAQQTVIIDRPSSLYDRAVETILWVNLRVAWLNQKIETSFNTAYNPEHGAVLFRSSAQYVFSDSWKAIVCGLSLSGPRQSIFGRYGGNDQIEMAVVYSW